MHDCAFATLTLALAELGAGLLSRAAHTLDAAGALFEQVGDRQYAAQVLLASAEVAARQGSPDAARLASKAVAELRAGGWLIPLAHAHLVAADVAPDDDAREVSLAEVAPLIEELGLPSLRYERAVRLGRVRRRRGAVDAAADLFQAAIDTAELMGTALPDPILQTAFRTDKAPAYDELVDLLVSRAGPGDLARATAISDLAKARTLIDLICRTAGAPTQAVPADSEDHAELEMSQADLSAVYAALADEGGSSRRTVLWQRAAGLEQRIVALRTRLAAVSPRPLPAADGPADDTAREHPGMPVLRYHVLGPDVLAFVRLDGTDRVRRLSGATAAIDTALDTLAAQWQRFRIGRDFVRRNAAVLARTTDEVLRTLYDLMIAPVRPWLDEAQSADLTVVPHLRLGEVPFHALHDGDGYLVQTWATTIRPTTMPVRHRRGALDPARGAPLVLAVPDPRAPAIDAEAARARAGIAGRRRSSSARMRRRSGCAIRCAAGRSSIWLATACTARRTRCSLRCASPTAG